jgi:hypothetical protein
MVAFHHPLVPGWIFSKAKGTGTVSLAPPSGGPGTRAGKRRGAGPTFAPGAGDSPAFTLLGRRVREAPANGMGPRAPQPPLRTGP